MKLDILAFGAHPDDVELGCAGTLSKSITQGKKVGIVDLTQGEMGTRGTPQLRLEEAQKAAELLGVAVRENLGFRDAFFVNDEIHQRQVIQKIRAYQPEIVLCNAYTDRHIDHGKGSTLVREACFLSGLVKVVTQNDQVADQSAWRPKLVLEYIQWEEITPDIVLDISGHLEQKIRVVKAYSSQFYNPDSQEKETPISSSNFLESIHYRARNLGRLIGTEAGEGFTSQQTLAVGDLFSLLSVTS